MDDPHPRTPPTHELPDVIGIGASAGGLEAIQELVDHLGERRDVAFVIVQHLSPDFRSLMGELLSRHTNKRIERIEDGMPVEADTLYLIPPRQNLVLEAGRLRLTEQVQGEIPKPIDIFFRSLADERGERAVGVILSGTGSDGSRGAQEIRAAGGLVVVQTPDLAAFDGMPQAAIDSGVADTVCAPRDMPSRMYNFLEGVDNSFQVGGPGDAHPDSSREILNLLLRERGVDFSRYKERTILRRLSRRMSIVQAEDYASYHRMLLSSQTEMDLLYQDLLIGVTEFYRDADAFKLLATQIASYIDERGISNFRAWVVPSATGEEAYTVAMLLEEQRRQRDGAFDYKVFATDVNAKAVRFGAEGRYPQGITDRLSPTQLEACFSEEDGGFRIRPELRSRVVFAAHDVTKDPPFTRMDLVTCRNLLIYLQPEIQDQVLSLLHFAIKPGGLLLLGPSEVPSVIGKQLREIDQKWRIYEKHNHAVGGQVAPLGVLFRQHPQRQTQSRERTAYSPGQAQDRITAAFLDQFTRACVVVDENYDVQQVFGEAAELLSIGGGRVTWNILKLVPSGLRAAMSTTLHRARKTGEAISTRGLPLSGQDLQQEVIVRWIPASEEREPGFYLLFVRHAERVQADAQITNVDGQEDLVNQLEQDLAHTKESLQSTIEELETTNEELQSTNEELLASNEELQSTNEELHSVNEELYTVNAEHQSKIQELTTLSDDIENLLRSTEIGVVFLDEDLNIRRFTPRVREVIAILDSDIGRPISHLAQNLRDFDISDLAREVLASQVQTQQEVLDTTGQPWMVSGRPYQSGKNIKGAVLTFVDIAPIKAAEESLARSELRFRRLVEQIDQVFWIFDPSTRDFVYASPRFEQLWGISARELYADAQSWLEPVAAEDRDAVQAALERLGPEETFHLEFRLETGERRRWIHMRGFPLRDESRQINAIAGLCSDITAAKEDRIRLATSESRMRSMIEGLPDVLWLTDASGERFTYCSPAFEQVFGYSPAALLESPSLFFESIDRTDRELVRENWAHIAEQGIDAEYRISRGEELRWIHTRGYPIQDSTGRVTGICGMLRDVTEQKDEAEQLRTVALDMENQAQTDMLTGLFNRRGIEMALARERLRAARNGQHTATILLDIDDFKAINTEHGHQIGDEVLRQIGRQVRTALRPSDLAGRVGGDEFLVVLPETRLAEGVRIAERIRLAIADAGTPTEDTVVRVTSSLGLAMVPSDMISIEEILTATREALASCKAEGKNKVIVTTDQEGQTCILSPVGGSVADQLENLDLRAVAQGIHRLEDDAVVGYEMFSRGPEGPFANPSNIFRLSQEQSVLTRTDMHCLRRCVEASTALPPEARVHVNLFPTTLTDAGPEQLIALFEANGGAQRFCVELSEQQFLGAPDYLKKAVRALRKAGVKCVLDDVGFGRSSLESLILLEPDIAKISNNLIRGADESTEKRRNLERLVRILSELCPVVIAKGIETSAEAELLQECGLREGQGFYFAKPQPVGQGA